MSARTAAALVIGNELLTGKIQDANVATLARLLFQLGIALRRVVFCSDEVEVIAEDLDRLRRGHDLVFTSGGVGPTHDDVTLAAVTRAFGRPLVRSPVLEGLLRGYFGERTSAAVLRMADIPEGAELITGSGRWPVLLVDNVFVLPGLPEVFRRKLPILREHLAGDRPFVSRRLGSRQEEPDLAELLDRLHREHPEVDIGSYPRWGSGEVRVVLTLDGRDEERVDVAFRALVAALPAGTVVADVELGEAAGELGSEAVGEAGSR